MEESHFLGVANPLNLYSICKVWHTGVLKVLVASENVLHSAMALEGKDSLSWIFENDAILTLPERSQVISVATANPLMMDRPGNGDTTAKPSRRCLVGVTYCIPPLPQETPPPEPEIAPAARPAPTRPTGPGSAFVSRVLQAARPPPSAPSSKPVESAPQPLIPPRFFFSILGANSFENDHWSTIVQDNITFELPYVPFVLAKYAPPNSSSVLFMLSGADRKLHIFNQHADTSAADTETSASPSPEASETKSQPPLKLPLLELYPSPVVSLDILDAMDGRIYVVVGCQDGSVVLTSGDASGIVCSHISTSLDGPITSVKIYQVAKNRSQGSELLVPTENDQNTNRSGHPSVRRLAKHINRSSISSAPSSPRRENSTGGPVRSPSLGSVEKVTTNEFAINVVVASAVGFAAVFRNVAEDEFNDVQLLPDSDKHDSVLGLAVSDIDHDGHVEILVGTYGQRLLAYAETKGKPASSKRSAPPAPITVASQPPSPPPQTPVSQTQPSLLTPAALQPIPQAMPGAPSADPSPPRQAHGLGESPVSSFTTRAVINVSSASEEPSLEASQRQHTLKVARDSEIIAATEFAVSPSSDNPEPVINSPAASEEETSQARSASPPEVRIGDSGGPLPVDISGRTTPSEPTSPRPLLSVTEPSLSALNSPIPENVRALDTPDDGSEEAQPLGQSARQGARPVPSQALKQSSATLLRANTEPFSTEDTPGDAAVDPQTRKDVGTKFANMIDTIRTEYQRDNLADSVTQHHSKHRADASETTSSGLAFPSISEPSQRHEHRHTDGGIQLGSLNTDSSAMASYSRDSTSPEPPAPSEAPTHSFSLLWHKSFNHPIYQIMCDDFVHDGTNSIITSTLYGIHLLRSDLDTTAAKAQRRLSLLSDIIKLERQLYRQERQKAKEGGLAPISPMPPKGPPSPSPSESVF